MAPQAVREHEDQPVFSAPRRTPGCQAHAALSMRARCSQHCAGQRGPQERHRRRFPGARGNLHNQPEQCGEPGPSCSNPHACSGEPCQLRGTHREALIAILQHGQGILWHHRLGHTGWTAARSAWRTAAQLAVASSPGTPRSPSQVIDASLDLQVPFAHQVAQRLRELQEKVHGVEDVHLVSDELGLLSAWAQVLAGLLRHPSQALQKALEGTAGALDSLDW